MTDCPVSVAAELRLEGSPLLAVAAVVTERLLVSLPLSSERSALRPSVASLAVCLCCGSCRLAAARCCRCDASFTSHVLCGARQNKHVTNHLVLQEVPSDAVRCGGAPRTPKEHAVKIEQVNFGRSVRANVTVTVGRLSPCLL